MPFNPSIPIYSAPTACLLNFINTMALVRAVNSNRPSISSEIKIAFA